MYCVLNMSRNGVGVCLHGCLTWTIIRMVGAVRCVLCDYALKTNHVGGLIRQESGAAPLMSRDADYSDLLHPQTLWRSPPPLPAEVMGSVIPLDFFFKFILFFLAKTFCFPTVWIINRLKSEQVWLFFPLCQQEGFVIFRPFRVGQLGQLKGTMLTVLWLSVLCWCWVGANPSALILWLFCADCIEPQTPAIDILVQSLFMNVSCIIATNIIALLCDVGWGSRRRNSQTRKVGPVADE